jgi:glutamate dehydrogenase (NAD(P)+)
VIPDVYLNAGGVTVSYFEWTKNLSHMHYGRMSQHIEAMTAQTFIDATEQLTGKKFDERSRGFLLQARDELALVNSGLEDTMRTAYREIRDLKKRRSKMEDLRMAAYALGIERVGTAYLDLGIFP